MKNLFVILMFLSVNLFAETNLTNYIVSDVTNYNNLSNAVAWNFVEDSKNLTSEEKKYFNDLASSAQRTMFGMQMVNTIASEVRALDNEREIQKILKQVKASISNDNNTNIIWMGSVVVQHFNKIGSNHWESSGDILQKWGMWANPTYKIGFRSDGVVVWREEE